MRLIDCYVELFSYVCYLSRESSAEEHGYDRVKADISELITRSRECCQQNNFSASDVELADFAVFTWIDEVVLSSSWHEKERWQGEQLQRLYFQTVDGGELFFDKLNTLQPHQLEVREVYYICLALGFAGRFCNPGDEILLNQLKSSNLKLLGDASERADQLVGQTLCPKAYSTGAEVAHGMQKGRLGITTLLAFSFPLMLFALLFGVYRFVLSNVGENLIRSIK